mmetsp:Transcript_15135/g.22651  ORF Transcript_15135/g.22651 Transcript_15135/m.22651 type:complete len:505 (+) Transcript_15135:208-1722(+)
MSNDGSPKSQAEKTSKTANGPTFLVLFAFLTISLASGLVYGWPTLRRLLVEEGTAMTEKDLGGIFTLGSWCTQGGRFLSGISRDRLCGTRITAALCLLAAAMGCTGLAFADKDDKFALSISLFLVGIGSGSQLCLQPVAGMFDKSVQGTILASFSGAFQISGLVFLVLSKITSDRKKSIGYFSLVLLVLVIVALRVLPKLHFSPKNGNNEQLEEEEEEEDDDSESRARHRSLTVVEDGNDEQDALEEGKEEDDSETGAEHRSLTVIKDGNEQDDSQCIAAAGSEVAEKIESEEAQIFFKENADEEKKHNNSIEGVMQLIKSIEYILLLLWFSVSLIPLQYYVATIGFQLERKGDDSGRYVALFSILYASAAILSPLVGKIADKFGVGVGQSLATILSATSFFLLSSDSLSLDAHIIGMTFYGVGRMIVFGLFFTNVGKRFGFVHYGTLAGLGLLISSIAGNLQYPLIALAADGYEKEVNIACGTVLLIQGLPYCLWLSRRERRE